MEKNSIYLDIIRLIVYFLELSQQYGHRCALSYHGHRTEAAGKGKRKKK